MLRFEDQGMGLSISRGGRTTLSLPSVEKDRDPGKNLRTLLKML